MHPWHVTRALYLIQTVHACNVCNANSVLWAAYQHPFLISVIVCWCMWEVLLLFVFVSLYMSAKTDMKRSMNSSRGTRWCRLRGSKGGQKDWLHVSILRYSGVLQMWMCSGYITLHYSGVVCMWSSQKNMEQNEEWNRKTIDWRPTYVPIVGTSLSVLHTCQTVSLAFCVVHHSVNKCPLPPHFNLLDNFNFAMRHSIS